MDRPINARATRLTAARVRVFAASERLEDARHIVHGNAWPHIRDVEERVSRFPYVNYDAV